MPQTIPLALAVAEKAFREFRNQWLSGLQPILSLETASDGEIHFIFKVVAGDATGQQEEVLPRGGGDEEACYLAAKAAQRLRRRSPSYRRRLLKRAAARAAGADTVTAVKFVQAKAENLPSNTPPNYDPVLPCMLAVEAEYQPQHCPQYLPQDEVCSDEIDEIYAESCPATLPQLDGHNESHVLNRSEINVSEFVDIIKKQENDRRKDFENARKEREAERDEDLRNLRRMVDLPHL